MKENDPDQLADRLEREAGQLGRQSEELRQKTADVREDWDRKRADGSVPGAPAPGGEKAERRETRDAEEDRSADDAG